MELSAQTSLCRQVFRIIDIGEPLSEKRISRYILRE